MRTNIVLSTLLGLGASVAQVAAQSAAFTRFTTTDITGSGSTSPYTLSFKFGVQFTQNSAFTNCNPTVTGNCQVIVYLGNYKVFGGYYTHTSYPVCATYPCTQTVGNLILTSEATSIAQSYLNTMLGAFFRGTTANTALKVQFHSVNSTTAWLYSGPSNGLISSQVWRNTEAVQCDTQHVVNNPFTGVTFTMSATNGTLTYTPPVGTVCGTTSAITVSKYAGTYYPDPTAEVYLVFPGQTSRTSPWNNAQANCYAVSSSCFSEMNGKTSGSQSGLLSLKVGNFPLSWNTADTVTLTTVYYTPSTSIIASACGWFPFYC